MLLSLQTHNSYAIVAHIIVLLLLHTHHSVAIAKASAWRMFQVCIIFRTLINSDDPPHEGFPRAFWVLKKICSSALMFEKR